MEIFSRKNKTMKITVIAIVVVMLTFAISGGVYAIYTIFFSNKNFGDPVFPTPVLGSDATAQEYQKAAEYGKTRTVCITGRYNGLIDNKTFWSGFFVSEDGYIITNYSRASSGSGIPFITFTDYVITVLDKNGDAKTYYASATTHYNKTTDILLLKIKDAPIGTKFEYFEVTDSSTVNFGTPALIMGDPLNLGLTAHSATIGNPSTIYKDGNGLNDYMNVAVMLVNGAVNVGSKGSPLINGDGKVIGMILSKFLLPTDKRPNDTVMDLGFAAKSDNILALIEKTKESV